MIRRDAKDVLLDFRLTEYATKIRRIASNGRIDTIALTDYFFPAELEEIAAVLEEVVNSPTEGS